MLQIIKEQFQQKKRYAHFILFLQIIALMVIAGWTFWNRSGQGHFYALDGSPAHSYCWANFQTNNSLVILGDFIFAFLSSWLNEKINLSQTWRLLPVSSTKLWLSNLFSSILTCVYLFVSQLLLLFLTALPVGKPLYHTLWAFALYPDQDNWLSVLTRILFIFALAFFVYLCVSLVDFVSQAIVAFLPVKNSRWAKRLVMVLLTIVIVIVVADSGGHFAAFMLRETAVHPTWSHDPLWLSNLLLWLLNLLIGILDLWLFDHFVESKIDR